MHIDFKEMEIQDMYGDIGVKCPIRQVIEDEDGNEVVISEGVDVVPSRESVRWTAATRDFLKKQFTAAQEEASSIVEKELNIKDFLNWLNACKSVTSLASGSNNVLSRLSKIVELNEVRPKFPGTNIRFSSPNNLLRTFKLELATKYLDKADRKFKVTRSDVTTWATFSSTQVYFKTTNATRLKDVYIADKWNSKTFNIISPKTDEALQVLAGTLCPKGADVQTIASKALELKNEQDALIKLLQASEDYKSYDDVEVPDDYIKNLTDLEQAKGLQEDGTVIVTDKERRKLEQRVVCNTFEPRYFPYWQDKGSTYQKSKREPKFETIKNYEGKLYYGVTEDMPKLQLACHFADNFYKRGNYRNDNFYNDDCKILAVSVSNKKHFKMHMHVNDFFGKYKNTNEGVEITMDDSIVAWNTARKLKPLMDELLFMRNFETINKDVYKDYKRLHDYTKRHYVNLEKYHGRDGMKDHYADLKVFLDKIELLQGMVESQSSQEDIQAFVKDEELVPGLNKGIAVNREMLDLMEKLLTYAGPVKDLFNQINILKDASAYDIPMTLSMYIAEIIDWKGLTYEKEKVKEEVQQLETVNQ